MMTRTLIVLLSWSTVVSGCGSQTDQAAEAERASAENDTHEARAYVERVNAQINALIKAGDFESAGQHFAPDVIQLISGQPPIQGREEWIERQRAAAMLGEWDLQLEVIDLEVSGDMAIERGRGVQSFTAGEGSPMPSMTMVGDYLVYWQKVGEGWQIKWDYVVLQEPAGP